MRGKPLMPTSSSKARRLLKSGKAKVVKRFPFTIQLLYATGECKQEIVLGVDTGYKNIGLSCVTESKELFSAEVKLRYDIVELLSEKRMYRKHKRNKLWHRKPRFLNRGIPIGWLAPSILHKFNSHLTIIKKIHNILPISKIIVELAKFNIQKIKNPEIQGKEYQCGEQKGFNNVRAYVLFRDGYKCSVCKKSKVKLHVHHIESRMVGGDAPNNLITLCDKCHSKSHDGKVELKIRRGKTFKSETYMSTVKKMMIEKLRELYNNVEETFGYLTKEKRLNLKLEKSHFNDAFCIANGENQIRCNVKNILQRRKNNRGLQIKRKKFGISIRRQRYSIQPQDLIKVEGKEYVSCGSRSYGREIIILKDGKKENIGIGKVDSVYHVGTWIYN